ncbi:serine hydrolase [Roseivirga sp. E12]|uniref:serine hydrolase domain-containing protein n=1 Tax=Roseivirga sp. E12 TaxID=2819237 RepID=UPI001ABD3289|nr:serine hydrolase domain-containing protein [Roseivirga sp. E12]MBO3697729.1 serine hydrolase [Roseivirga sp. E12]
MYSKSLLIALFVISNIAVHAQTTKAHSELDGKIDALFQNYEGRPGVAVAVVKNGETLFQKGYGLSNLEYNIPITPQTIFDVSAVAKQLTAACVFLLESEGKLSLNDPIQKFFPEFPEYAEGQVTVKNLIYQTSGIRSYLAIIFSQNRYAGDRMDNEDARHMVMKQRNLNFEPGTRLDYSNSNYALLSDIVEQVSGKKLTEYAKEKLFDPLNMVNTSFVDRAEQVIKNRAIAYQEEEGQFVLNHFFNSAVVGDGMLYINLEDLIRWSNNLSTGAVGGKELIAKIITPGRLNSGAATNYGGGIYNQNHYDIEGLPSIRHAGASAGFRSLYYKFLNQDVAFIILSNNADTNVWAHLDELTPLFLEDEIGEAQTLAAANAVSLTTASVKLNRKEKQRLSGSFYNTINGNLRWVELLDGKLFYKRSVDAPGTPLVAISSNELVFEALPFVKLSFNQGHKQMIFTVNDLDPIAFDRYESVAYEQADLKEFENNYYNEDLEVTYQVKSKEGQLQLLIEGEELVVLTPFSQDMFREEHFGYIKFQRDNSGRISSFSRTDNTFTNLVFHLLKNAS